MEEAHACIVCLFQIDAHMDINTPFTTNSGNLHGMPLSMLIRGIPEVTSTEDTLCVCVCVRGGGGGRKTPIYRVTMPLTPQTFGK